MEDHLGGHPPDEQLMTLARSDQHGYTVLVVRGDVDLATEGRLMEAAAEAVQDPSTRPVVLDLAGVGFLSSSGMGRLVAIAELAEAARVQLRIVTGDNPRVLGPLRMLGLDLELALFRTIADATGP